MELKMANIFVVNCPEFSFSPVTCLENFKEQSSCVDEFPIDPMQKWLPLNYSFVRIQNSLTNLVRDNKFLSIFVSKTRLVRLI